MKEKTTKVRNLLCVFTIFLFCISTFAQASAQNAETRGYIVPGKLTSLYQPEGIWGFVGVNLGVVDSETRLNQEKDVNGSQLNLKGLGSYYFPESKWLLDVGLGLQNSHFREGQIDKDVTALYIEVSPRFQVTESWQFGPVGKLFALGDNDFFSDNAAPVGFLGGAVNYEWPLSDERLIRFGGRVLTDVNVDSRRVTMAMLDVQVGMPFSSKPQVRTVERSRPSIFSPPLSKSPIIESKPITLEEMMAKKDIPLDKNISFQLGKVTPTLRSQKFLSELGKRLASEDIVEGVVISGHTDDLGKPTTNSILSHSRAQFAAQTLVSAGLSVEKVEARAYSDTQPLTLNREEKFKNRRIEILFKGVRDEERLSQVIQELM